MFLLKTRKLEVFVGRFLGKAVAALAVVVFALVSSPFALATTTTETVSVTINAFAQMAVSGSPSLNPAPSVSATGATTYSASDASTKLGFLVAGRAAATITAYVSTNFSSLPANTTLTTLSVAGSGTAGEGPSSGSGTATSAAVATLAGTVGGAVNILTNCQGNYYNIPITFTLNATGAQSALAATNLTVTFTIS